MPTKTKISKFLAGKELINQIEALSDLNSNSMEPFRNNKTYWLLRDLEGALCELFSREITAYYNQKGPRKGTKTFH